MCGLLVFDNYYSHIAKPQFITRFFYSLFPIFFVYFCILKTKNIRKMGNKMQTLTNDNLTVSDNTLSLLNAKREIDRYISSLIVTVGKTGFVDVDVFMEQRIYPAVNMIQGAINYVLSLSIDENLSNIDETSI